MLKLLPLLLPTVLAAQFSIAPAYPPVSAADGSTLDLAWFGGLNAPQTQAADLNGDGLQDLYIFDRAGEINLALRGDGNGNYSSAPELTANFPALEGWAILRDFNNDGITDLFTWETTVAGIRVYQGERTANGLLRFSLLKTALRYPLDRAGTTTIFVTNIDYPAVNDIDYDGDLDILTFSVGGGYVEYYKNQSVEMGFGTDSLIYELETECWGGFFESGISTELDLAAAPGECFNRNLGPGEITIEPRHAGSTVLAIDVNGDSLQDIMLGDISFEFIALGINEGTRDEAYIGAQDPTWPSNGKPVDIDFFPAVFHLDFDGDGARDILASPTQTTNVEDLDVIHYYRNLGSDTDPDFVFQDSQLLVRDMIDYGTSSRPAIFDYDADGRPDLVVGNSEEYTGTNFIRSQLRLLRNVTPPGGETAFEVVDSDFLGLGQLQAASYAYAPAFGDVDGDQDVDAIIGVQNGTLIFYENTAGAGRPAVFAPPVFAWQDLDAGQFAKPTIKDLDRDGLPDLIVGGFDGRIRFFRNFGTSRDPQFSADLSAPGNQLQLGGIDTRTSGSSTGYPTPRVLDYGDRFLLLTGNQAGRLESYEFTDITGPFTQLSGSLDAFSTGSLSDPAFADFDGNGTLEMVVGNERGGLNFYTTDLLTDISTSLFAPVRPDFAFTVAPNPVRDLLYVSDLAGPRVQRLRLMSSDGRQVRELPVVGRERVSLDLTGLPAGVYALVAEGAAGVGVRKVVKL